MDRDRPRRNSTRGRGMKWFAGILAVLVHLAFIAFLIFGVKWQNKPAAPVTAELYSPPVAKSVPVPEPPPPPPPEPKPEPKPEPEPKVEPPKPTRAEIELKAKKEKER